MTKLIKKRTNCKFCEIMRLSNLRLNKRVQVEITHEYEILGQMTQALCKNTTYKNSTLSSVLCPC